MQKKQTPKSLNLRKTWKQMKYIFQTLGGCLPCSLAHSLSLTGWCKPLHFMVPAALTKWNKSSHNLLLTVWTCRQQWSSFLLCHLHSHWMIQRLSPPSLTEQGQDQGQTYLPIKLNWIINDPTLLLRHLLNHGVDSSAFLVSSDHRALVLITVAIWKNKKLNLFFAFSVEATCHSSSQVVMHYTTFSL